MTRVTVPEEEIARFREVAKPIHDAWISDMASQGFPAQELYDLVQSTLDKERM